MKTINFLIFLAGFSLQAAADCPTFVFFCDNPNRCDGRADMRIEVCPASVTDPYVVDYVIWNFGDGTIDTAHTLDYSYTYASSGGYNVSATVYCTVNGTPCSAPAYVSATAFGTLDALCASSPANTSMPLFVSLFSMSLFVSSPAQPATIYPGDAVTVSAGYDGGLTGDSLVVYVDGTQISAGGSLSGNPANVWTDDFAAAGQHIVEVIDKDKGTGCVFHESLLIDVQEPADSCTTCFTFRPMPGERYWFSAWVKADVASAVKTYADLGIFAEISYTGSAVTAPLVSGGEIIEGWQRIAGEFTVPAGATEISINLVNDNATTDAYFDDVRVHPFNASMKTYVNDAATFWLVAELDDNNYATIYEYDKEGKLVRIKKETERGVFTIQESHMSNPKTN